MSVLVSYETSEEEAADPEGSPSPAVTTSKTGHDISDPQDGSKEGTHFSDGEKPVDKPLLSHHEPMNGAIIGPIVPQTDSVPREDMQTTPLSPYSAKRAAIRDLTVPPMPVLNIPPSPPGSPSSENEKKFQHFLELKKQGIHFNEKLANSSALKNPNLLQKLMDHAGLDEQDQYSFTFSENLFNPREFPPWAYKEELARSQQVVAKKKEEERAKAPHESIEFVSAAGSGPSGKGSTTTVNNGVRGVQGSAAERVMAGMDWGSTRSPQRSAQSVRSEHDRRKSRGIPSSPNRRKRSRSR